MVNHIIRKYQQPLLIVITVLIIICFVFYWNGSQGSHFRGGVATDVGTIYGKPMPLNIFQREARKFGVARVLRMNDLLETLVGQPHSEQEAVWNFTWNLLVLKHSAAEMQIDPTQDEVKTAIMNIPEFQTSGQFDSSKYSVFIDEQLTPKGFTDKQLEELIHEDLSVKKLKDLLGATMYLSPSDFQAQYKLEYQKTDVSVIRFNYNDFTAGMEVKDDDVKKVFELRVDNYRSDEKRGIKFVEFTLSPEDQALTGTERVDALKKLAGRASDFTQAMAEKGAKFDDVAAQFKLPVTTVKPFAASAPDPVVEKVPALVGAAFRATMEDPNSDAVQGQDGFYVMQLQEIQPTRQLTLPEAKPQIIDEIKKTRAQELLNVKAGEVRKKIQADLDAKKSFTDAAKAEGQKVDVFPPFSFTEPDVEQSDAKAVMIGSMSLKEGQLSELTPTDDGGVLIYVDKREPVEQAKAARDAAALIPRFNDKKVGLAVKEWLRRQVEKANIQIPQVAQKQPAAPQGGQQAPADQSGSQAGGQASPAGGAQPNGQQ